MEAKYKIDQMSSVNMSLGDIDLIILNHLNLFVISPPGYSSVGRSMGGENSPSIDQSGKNTAEDVVSFDKNKIPEVEISNLLVPDRHERERKFVRKLDLRLLPLMMLICTEDIPQLYRIEEKVADLKDKDVLKYLDRNNIATARLGTLEKDLGLHGNQYNTIISMIIFRFAHSHKIG